MHPLSVCKQSSDRKPIERGGGSHSDEVIGNMKEQLQGIKYELRKLPQASDGNENGEDSREEIWRDTS